MYTLNQTEQHIVEQFKQATLTTADFTHHNHLIVAYALLAEMPIEAAFATMKSYILNFLEKNGIGQDKFHHTVTYFWLQEVSWRMRTEENYTSVANFLDDFSDLCDPNYIKEYYSDELLASSTAKESQVSYDQS